MGIEDSRDAIGSVTRLLQARLAKEAQVTLTVGRPDRSHPGKGPRANLCLYEVQFDSSLRNSYYDTNRPAPVWLVLKYLVTAFDPEGDSDTDRAHDCLGRVIRAVQSVPVISLDDEAPSLRMSPEPLHLIVADTPVGLLCDMTSPAGGRYHLSFVLQVRPVLIVPAEDRSIAKGAEDRSRSTVKVVRTKLGSAPQS